MNIDELKSLLSFDGKTGEIHWIAPGKGRIKKKAAGCKMNNGYVGICLKGKRISAHRIAWALYYGQWPKNQIDHINGIRHDNRIQNLREATNSQNGKNRSSGKNNSSGVCGVYFEKQTQRWKAYIRVNYKNISIGRFDVFDDAVKARKEAEAKYFGEWQRSYV